MQPAFDDPKSMPDLVEPTILVVEDDELSRYAMSRLLLALGYTVASASNGVQAVKYAHHHAGPIIALVDFNLPDMTGLKLIRTLRRHGREIRAALITANSDETLNFEAENQSVSFLRKPVNFEHLISILAKFGEVC